MQFKILSHACLWVEHGGRSILIDPWLKGSAYWRSWWNFPPVDQDEVTRLAPDYILLTHLHWDHFHGPSLRALGRDRTILVPMDRYDRMARDLKKMGFSRVIEIPHAKPFRLGEDFALTPYLFSPIGDCAIVLSSCRVTLLNANDCKIVGWPLRQLLDAHPKVDFAFRSHSSANSRVLYERLDAQSEHIDEREAYFRSFSNFMAAVQPAVAIPFASNHCYLHRDTYRFNRWTVSPLEVRDYFEQYRQEQELGTQLQIMLPGSSWSETGGFRLVDTAPFRNRDSALQTLLAHNQDKLERYYQAESLARLPTEEVRNYFERVFAHAPLFLRWRFRRQAIAIRAYSGEVESGPSSCWRIDLWAKRIAEIDLAMFRAANARLEAPAIVLRHALRENMFGHVSISKRVRYQATDAAMPALRLFELLLCLEESELIPLRGLLTGRYCRSYLLRWRELVLYTQVAYLRFIRKIPFQEIEQRLLLRLAKERSNVGRS